MLKDYLPANDDGLGSGFTVTSHIRALAPATMCQNHDDDNNFAEKSRPVNECLLRKIGQLLDESFL